VAQLGTLDGLGPVFILLAPVADRLAAHGGTLTVRSRPGQGTTITGRLPLDPQRVARDQLAVTAS
jgi:signal transduction histidine kinase